jgi:hypothetical protein
VKRRFTALALALLAFPSAALADPAREERAGVTPHTRPLDRSPSSPLESRLPAKGTDVASRLPAKGTDVAAPDQQASTGAAAPAASVDDASGFDWGYAGIGAAALLGLLAVSLAGHRRASTVSG